MSDSVQPHRRQPTRLPRPWDSPGKNTGVGCHFLPQCMKVKSEVKLFSRVRLLATPWTVAYQAPASMGFSRQEYWSGLQFPSPRDVPDPGIKPSFPHCRHPGSRIMCPPRPQSPIHSSGSPRGASLEPNGFCLDGLIPEAAGDNDLREEGRWGVSLS